MDTNPTPGAGQPFVTPETVAQAAPAALPPTRGLVPAVQLPSATHLWISTWKNGHTKSARRLPNRHMCQDGEIDASGHNRLL